MNLFICYQLSDECDKRLQYKQNICNQLNVLRMKSIINTTNDFENFINEYIIELTPFNDSLKKLIKEILELFEIDKNFNRNINTSKNNISRKRKNSDLSNSSKNRIDSYFQPLINKKSDTKKTYKSNKKGRYTLKSSPNLKDKKNLSNHVITSYNLQVLGTGVVNNNLLSECSRFSFDSNIKRPYNINNINLSSAKTNLTYSSYHSNNSQFSELSIMCFY